MISHYQNEIDRLASNGSLRKFRPLNERAGDRVQLDGTLLLNMTSNDYLGIAGDRKLLEEFYSRKDTEESLLDNYGLGTASSRLLTGDTPGSHLLEGLLRESYGRPACLLFNSGYHANIGILPALAGKRDLILSDKLNHASIHDGFRLSRATTKRFRHRDYEHLRSILDSSRKDFETVIIVTESVFSMDGDEADLHQLVEIKRKYGCMLYLDEAHGIGVYGTRGLGKAEEYGVTDEIDLLVGTFGKACGSVGAFVLCEQTIYDYLVNFSRSLIFTTALPPVVIHWNAFVFSRIQAMSEQRRNLLELGRRMRAALVDNALKTDGNTNIVPVIIGDNLKTVTLAEEMQRQGFLIFAIRPPTVPEGTARFRLSLTATMKWDDIAALPGMISQQLRQHEI